MIESSKLEHIIQIGGMACEASGDTDFSQALLTQIETLLDADASVFYDMSGTFTRPVFGSTLLHNIEPEYSELYGEYYNQFDPCFNDLSAHADAGNMAIASTFDVIANEQEYEKTEYYQDFLRPQNVHSSIIFSLKNDQGLLGLFGFQRPKRREPFDEDSATMVRLISSSLLLALERRRRNLSKHTNALSESFIPTSLTPRQIQIAKLVTLGLSNPEISSELGISAKTVENHLTQIYAETGAKNRVTLAQALTLMLQTSQPR